MIAEITGLKLVVLQWLIPGAIGAILAIVPLWAVIKSLHKLLDALIEANADGKITAEEYNNICATVQSLKNDFAGLLKVLFGSLTKIKDGK